MLQTVREEIVDKKLRPLVWFPCSLRELWSYDCLKKCIFRILR